MTTPTTTERPESSLTHDLIYAARYYLGSRRGLLVLATIAVVAGAAFNWNWLVATGIAPILLTAVPCAVMCGLGLCFNRLFGGACATEQSRPMVAADRADEISAQPNRAPAISPTSDCCHDTPEAVAAAQETIPSDNERRDSHA
ncbi:MAG: hypothetical protein GEU91_02300 [Rhizobiales bacterium]|nr:hypothetical protein [Hyphomicrobiales bacterium]